ncbi:hypothetical protein KAR91_81540 [Candidatus Pacearchaeota archaeon]|nr:hypothetical protein [Candidatus Pacearchaeota archaeon]
MSLIITDIKDTEPDTEKQYIDLKDFIKEIKKKINKTELLKGPPLTHYQHEISILSTRLNDLSIAVNRTAIACAIRIAKKGTFTPL